MGVGTAFTIASLPALRIPSDENVDIFRRLLVDPEFKRGFCPILRSQLLDLDILVVLKQRLYALVKIAGIAPGTGHRILAGVE